MTRMQINLGNLDLTKLMKSRAEILLMFQSETVTVPDGELWLILTGSIHHITGTATFFSIHGNLEHYDLGYGGHFTITIDIAIASETIDMFSPSADVLEKIGGWRPLLLPEKSVLIFAGGTGSHASLQILRTVIK